MGNYERLKYWYINNESRAWEGQYSQWLNSDGVIGMCGGIWVYWWNWCGIEPIDDLVDKQQNAQTNGMMPLVNLGLLNLARWWFGSDYHWW